MTKITQERIKQIQDILETIKALCSTEQPIVPIKVFNNAHISAVIWSRALQRKYFTKLGNGKYKCNLEFIEPIHVKALLEKPEDTLPETLSNITDKQLIIELRRRGYSGTLSKVEKIEL